MMHVDEAIGVCRKQEKDLLRWYEYVEKMNERRLSKQMYKVSGNGRVGKGEPR